MPAAAKSYSPIEERLNVLSHAIGLLLSLAALYFLLARALHHGDFRSLFSVGLFGVSLVSLYAASTAYHSAAAPKRRQRLRIVDHAAIYLLIAGTYTPFSLLVLKGAVGWVIFGVSWFMAVVGVIVKLFFTGRFTLVSTLLYVFMGWIILFAIRPLVANMPPEGLHWLIAGGAAYTFGALIYMIKSLRFNHAIFHVFILMGSACHFISVFFYVLPLHWGSM